MGEGYQNHSRAKTAFVSLWILSRSQIEGRAALIHANSAQLNVRPLQSKLWEMRMSGKDGIARAVNVAASGRRLIVLHVFVKKNPPPRVGQLKPLWHE